MDDRTGVAGTANALPAADGLTSPVDWLASGQRTIEIEIAAMQALRAALSHDLGDAFSAAIGVLRAIRGRVIVTGVGKSGHIGCKIAATLASTGSPASFVHAAEASHGDLGMITENDAVLAMSWSGETKELAPIIAYAKRFRVPLVAVTSKGTSTLGRAADHVLKLPKVDEACPHGLAPTSSTVLQLAIGDALAIALLEARGFTPHDFRIFHPGGRLGASLQFAHDLMHAGEAVPLAPLGTRMSEAIVLMTAKGFGCLGVVDGRGRLVGIITDGDLRRHLTGDLLAQTVEVVMNARPKTVRPDTLVAAALEVINTSGITALFVTEGGKPVGILHFHDLLRSGVA
jgi:arabinose-5-phosphate isomerase